MRQKKWIEEARTVTRVGSDTKRLVIDRQKEGIPDVETLSDRQLLAYICTRHPGCMDCPADRCKYGQEYRRRVKDGTWGTNKRKSKRGATHGISEDLGKP